MMSRAVIPAGMKLGRSGGESMREKISSAANSIRGAKTPIPQAQQEIADYQQAVEQPLDLDTSQNYRAIDQRLGNPKNLSNYDGIYETNREEMEAAGMTDVRVVGDGDDATMLSTAIPGTDYGNQIEAKYIELEQMSAPERAAEVERTGMDIKKVPDQRNNGSEVYTVYTNMQNYENSASGGKIKYNDRSGKLTVEGKNTRTTPSVVPNSAVVRRSEATYTPESPNFTAYQGQMNAAPVRTRSGDTVRVTQASGGNVKVQSEGVRYVAPTTAARLPQNQATNARGEVNVPSVSYTAATPANTTAPARAEPAPEAYVPQRQGGMQPQPANGPPMDFYEPEQPAERGQGGARAEAVEIELEPDIEAEIDSEPKSYSAADLSHE